MRQQLNNLSKMDNEHMLATANGTRAIVKIDKKTREIRMMADENMCEKEALNASIVVDEAVFVFSDWGNTIVKLDLKSGMQSVKVLDSEYSLGIFSVFYINGYLYAFSCRRGIIYVIDPITFLVEKELNIYRPERANNICNLMVCRDNKLYIPGGDMGCIFIYDLLKDELLNIKIFEGDESVSTVAVDNDYLYVSGRKEAIIYKCILRDNIATVNYSWHLAENIKQDNFRLIQHIIIVDDEVYVIPNFGAAIYRINAEKDVESIVISNKEEGIERELWNPRIVYCGEIYNKLALIFEKSERQYYMIDFVTGEISLYNLYIDETEFAKVYQRVGTYTEDKFFLEEFLAVVSCGR